MAKTNPEDVRKKVAYIKKQKEELTQRNQAALEKKAEIFKKFPGVVLRPLSIIAAIASSICYVDSFLTPEFKEFKVYDSVAAYQDVINEDGNVIPTIHFHVYLNEEMSFNVLMHEKAYQMIESNEKLEVGLTPLLNTPRSVKFNANKQTYEEALEFNITKHRALPLALLILSLIIFFVRPKYGTQGLGFSYASFVLIPGIIVVLTLIVLDSTKPTGVYRMDAQEFLEINMESPKS